MRDKVLEWFANGERGVSSEAMARAVCGVKRDKEYAWGDHPSDPDDLKRCIKFLDAVPEARQHMDRVAKLSKVWKRLVENWTELESLFREEWPTNSAPKTYKRMKELGC